MQFYLWVIMMICGHAFRVDPQRSYAGFIPTTGTEALLILHGSNQLIRFELGTKLPTQPRNFRNCSSVYLDLRNTFLLPNQFWITSIVVKYSTSYIWNHCGNYTVLNYEYEYDFTGKYSTSYSWNHCWNYTEEHFRQKQQCMKDTN